MLPEGLSDLAGWLHGSNVHAMTWLSMGATIWVQEMEGNPAIFADVGTGAPVTLIWSWEPHPSLRYRTNV